MKKRLSFIILLSFISVTFMFQGCKKATEPELTTNTVTDIALTTAVSGGAIISDGGEDITEKGVCWSTSTAPTIADFRTSDGQGTADFTSNLTGLAEGTTYYVRAYATNSVGTAYGNEVTFTTGNVTGAVLTTDQATLVTANTASAGGSVTDAGGGTISERGVCWGTSSQPTTSDFKATSGNGTGAFTVNLTNLEDGTLYYYRAYAINSAGTTYGQEYQFLTLVNDVDGNEYQTVKIGDQVWMAENLKTTLFNDEEAIPNVTDATAWKALTTAGYSWVQNLETNKNLYGAIYNWYAVESENLCPEGWHVPTDAEFQTLEAALGMNEEEVAATNRFRGTDQGEQMKSENGWPEGKNGTNSSGFAAMPAGYRAHATGTFEGVGIVAYFWTTTKPDANTSVYRLLDEDNDGVFRNQTYRHAGKSIRCVKD